MQAQRDATTATSQVWGSKTPPQISTPLNRRVWRWRFLLWFQRSKCAAVGADRYRCSTLSQPSSRASQ